MSLNPKGKEDFTDYIDAIIFYLSEEQRQRHERRKAFWAKVENLPRTTKTLKQIAAEQRESRRFKR